jgi:hypothetical protein
VLQRKYTLNKFMGINSPNSSPSSFDSLSELVGQRVSFSRIKWDNDQNNEVVWKTDPSLPRLSGVVENMAGIERPLYKIRIDGRGMSEQHVFPESFGALDIRLE